ncbi:MAG: hypothetical protein CMH79_05275 [Nitrospinae bacterium]|nr:hypothetical protein [Nitrospinota bacterium]|tara:strand:+ start:25 stop:735 length:711 start_codon:yes stop_codon:yes gene_type:complete
MSVNTKNKTMLSTKDMAAGGGKVRPVLNPGNQVVKINNITFDQTPYDKDAYNITLHVETEPVKGEFEGFLVDPSNANGPRYEGQVGRVRFSPWPYKDADLPSGRKVSRDTEVLKSMIYLSEVLDMRDELDAIEASSIEEFMVEANKLFCEGPGCTVFFNACVAGREWENKEGYVNNDLFLPRMSKDGIPLEALNKENSRLLSFNKENHIIPVKKKNTDENVNSFEPNGAGGDDFEL